MHQVLAIINIQLHIQASYYDNQNNRGRDEKKQFRGNEGIDSKRWLMPCIIIQPRFPMVPARVFTRFSQTFDEVEMPTRSYMTSHAPSFGNYQYSITTAALT